jgi:hypothetical protein
MEASEFKPLAGLLERRMEVIADHGWRDRDAQAHLAELQRVSEAIQAEHQRLSGKLPPRLEHFLSQASYTKALDWIKERG